MNSEFWQEKWRTGSIAFHQAEVNPALPRFFSKVPKGKVFVPLCGKTGDMRWLRDQGHEVIGVELSEIACRDFFSESAIPFEETASSGFRRFSGGGITIWCGDFFQLPREVCNGVTLVYDRAALIALPAEKRKEYADQLKALLLPGRVAGLLLTMEYGDGAAKGPPFSVEESEVRALFGDKFEVELLVKTGNDISKGNPKFSGVNVVEGVYWLR